MSFGEGFRRLFGARAEPGKKDRLAILVDYENVSREAALGGQVLDFDKLVNECLQVGFIDFSFVFVPSHLVTFRLPDYIYGKGFNIISCPSAYNSGNQLKEKDQVDTIMSEMGLKLVERTDITHLVIVSHDGDFVRLANQAKFHGKKIIAVAGERISFLLKQVVDVIYPLPLKGKNGNGY